MRRRRQGLPLRRHRGRHLAPSVRLGLSSGGAVGLSLAGMPKDTMNRAAGPLLELLAIMRRLRDPAGGCPWDREQTFATIAPYTIEEAYEVAEAIRAGDLEGLRDELGDLLFQVVFHSQMAAEAGHFVFDDVVRSVVDKMVRRHPHVFGEARVADAAAQNNAWEAHKRAERRRAAVGAASALDGVAAALPALMRAQKLQRRAADAGFDWPAGPDGIAMILDKIEEEVAELRQALAASEPSASRPDDATHEELGDLLFAVVNLVRHLKGDAEEALRQANSKFERRYREVERRAQADGRDPGALDLDTLESYWQAAKRAERGQAT